jgi:hypothetical protein
MLFGVDLTGEERERYEAVRAARIKMELEGVPSPYVVDHYSPLVPEKNRRPQGLKGRPPKIVWILCEWLAGRDKFRLIDAANACGCSTYPVWKAYKYLLENNLTDARLMGSGNKK